jgi:DNA-binding response OmpR family regulator
MMNAKPRILVVDDNHSLVRAIEGILYKAGFQVITAFDGLQGLKKARLEKPDLLILDIVMPEMDGYEVCRHLQDDPETASIPVLLLTVKGQLDIPAVNRFAYNSRIRERMDGFEVGALDFMSKPVKAEELLERVKGLIWFTKL